MEGLASVVVDETCLRSHVIKQAVAEHLVIDAIVDRIPIQSYLVVSDGGCQEGTVSFFVFVAAGVVDDVEQTVLDFGRVAMELGLDHPVGVFHFE